MPWSVASGVCPEAGAVDLGLTSSRVQGDSLRVEHRDAVDDNVESGGVINSILPPVTHRLGTMG